MNTENIRKWIDALRSGKYAQTVGSLSNSEGYCCLGVACDLAIQDGQSIAVEYSEAEAEYKYDGTGGLLPTVVMKWLGVDSPNPGVYVDGYKENLATLNDQGETFTTIADLIESTYLGEK